MRMFVYIHQWKNEVCEVFRVTFILVCSKIGEDISIKIVVLQFSHYSSMDIFLYCFLTCFCHWLRMSTSYKRIWMNNFTCRRFRDQVQLHLADTIRYDSGYLTCSKKLTGSQLSLPHVIAYVRTKVRIPSNVLLGILRTKVRIPRGPIHERS